MASETHGIRRSEVHGRRKWGPGARSFALASLCWAASAQPAWAQDQSANVQDPNAQSTDQQADTAALPDQPESEAPTTDIFSRNTVSVLLDGRIAIANGAESWVDRGLGKTRFDGTDDGDYKIRPVPAEAMLLWTPRFTRSLSANVSAGYQQEQDNAFDLIEAFLQFNPERSGSVGVSARAGLMWPEISQEHSTGGAWSVVNSITPSAINAWVGEEVKVLGVEGTLHVSASEHEFAATLGVFGWNDTSGTLLSFRGWALHDIKATAFGYFPLPPLNDFIVHLQQDKTKSLKEIDDRPGFYGRLDWRPPWPVGVNLFYYNNRGDPEAFTAAGQWGWRTRFWNLGLNADLGPSTRLLAQGMTGSTIMGFETNGERWVHTHFKSAYALLTHQISDRWAVSGRIEAFETNERGSEMSHADESEDGWSWMAAARFTINDNLTAFFEALNVRSDRGTRNALGLDSFQAQTVFQAALRFRL